jgi:phosphoglucosamine mutase
MGSADRSPPFVMPRFGTDGLRGVAGEPPMDPETLRRVGASLGLWLQRQGPEAKRVLVANDGRDSAGWIVEALAQGLASTDCVTVDLGLATTPALACVTRLEPFVAGIMVSASHNPAADNGIKLFRADGTKIDDDAEREIEGLTTHVEPGRPAPRIRERADLLSRYEAHVANQFAGLDLGGATVVVDAANGGGSFLVPSILRMLGADVVEFACEPDGSNINAGAGALHPGAIVETVRQSGAVLGVCLDGDGDRSIFVDDVGTIHDGDGILATLAPALLEAGQLPRATVVATVMSNLGLRKSLAAAGIRVEMTAVGDRNVAACMRANGYSLGAEQSGHVLFDRDGYILGDGLLTTLAILSLPGILTNGASRTFVSFPRFPQILVNVPVLRKPPLEDVAAIQVAKRRIEEEFGDEGRVVLRYSGTENLCRVMVEGPDRPRVVAHAEALAAAVAAALEA